MTSIDIPGGRHNPKKIPIGESLLIHITEKGFFFHDGKLAFVPSPCGKVKLDDYFYSVVVQEIGAKITLYFLSSKGKLFPYAFEVIAPPSPI